MKKFLMESPILHNYCTRRGARWICYGFVDDFFVIPNVWPKISIRLTNYPLKEAVKVKLTSVCGGAFENNYGQYSTFLWQVARCDCPLPYMYHDGCMYNPLARWLSKYPPLKKLKHDQALNVYISIYIHG